MATATFYFSLLVGGGWCFRHGEDTSSGDNGWLVVVVEVVVEVMM
jgi:hypothetical protein